MVVPGLRNLLGLTPLGLADWLVVGGTAVTPLLINEATKRPQKMLLKDTEAGNINNVSMKAQRRQWHEKGLHFFLRVGYRRAS